MTSTPILITIFNRPDKVRRLMEALAAAKPQRLYISADGPRADRPDDAALCAEARRIASSPSWPCEVKTRFLDENQGINRAMIGGIAWFFEHEPEGIILEDDCVPSPDFFRFCEGLLDAHRDNGRVMMISGNNFQDSIRRGDASYYFSRYPNIWGWATWRRAWQAFDQSLSGLDGLLADKGLKESVRRDEWRHWTRYFRQLRSGKYSSWDAKWVFAVWKENGVCAVPNANLVQNIGFGEDATNTKETMSRAEVSAASLPETIVHPSSVEPDAAADAYLFAKVYRVSPLRRVRNLVRRRLGI